MSHEFVAGAGAPAQISLVDPDEWRTRCAGHVFPSYESLRWFMRQHAHELIRSGAICSPSRRQLIEPTKFAEKVLEIGARLAAFRAHLEVDTEPTETHDAEGWIVVAKPNIPILAFASRAEAEEYLNRGAGVAPGLGFICRVTFASQPMGG